MTQHRHGLWRPLQAPEFECYRRLGFSHGWRIGLQTGSVQFAEVDHLILAIDRHYPNSQPRMFAPAAGSDCRWPHVEDNGLLCLRPSRLSATTADRVAFHLDDTERLLNFTASECQLEFQREFAAYWSRLRTKNSRRVEVYSLVTTKGESRSVVYFFEPNTERFIFADDMGTLRAWLRNIGINPRDKQILPAWLFVLARPWAPSEFPEVGGAITKLLPPDLMAGMLLSSSCHPVLFEAKTSTGSVFASALLHGPSKQTLNKGFRHSSRIPHQQVINAFASRPVDRCTVTRVDGPWIHGRDQRSSYDVVKSKKVAIVGCGAIGGSVARLLAQAGVGEMVLVDPDDFAPANVSRHLLGIDDAGLNKARALGYRLRSEFPHLKFNETLTKRFDRLDMSELQGIAGCDLVVAAAIDVEGEATLNSWRQNLAEPPAYLSAWAEAFAVAGHAVLLYGHDSLFSRFDEDERPTFRLSDWPDEAGELIVEAGCGNRFQPHGVVDLHPIVGLAAGLALDGLLDKMPVSCRRVWMGNSSDVERLGGKLRPTFSKSQAIQEFNW